VALSVLDRAIQVHGGMGVCQDTPLAGMWAGARTLRLADGPDEVHLRSVARQEIGNVIGRPSRSNGAASESSASSSSAPTGEAAPQPAGGVN
jgi:hypothetical protein